MKQKVNRKGQSQDYDREDNIKRIKYKTHQYEGNYVLSGTIKIQNA